MKHVEEKTGLKTKFQTEKKLKFKNIKKKN